MDYKLNEVGGRVRYFARMNGALVGSETSADTARWMLAQGKPERSDEVEGYAVRVEVRGTEYLFAGEWPEKKPVRRRAKK